MYSQQITLSASDLTVESANEKYTFTGKGISTLIAGELRRTGGIRLLEREKMNKIIEEQKLSLSGMIDESKQVETGKIPAADYIVLGNIIDMASIPWDTPWVETSNYGARIFGDYQVKDWQVSLMAGYLFPVSDNMGPGFGAVTPMMDNQVYYYGGSDPLDFEVTMINRLKSYLLNYKW